jgi:hypothetical protein
MSAASNIALYNLILSQDTAAMTALYDAIKYTPTGDSETIRFFHQEAPTGIPKPYIVYSAVEGDHAKHLLGDSGMNQAEYSFNVWGSNTLDHGQIAELLRLAFNGLIGKTVSGVNFRSIFVNQDIEDILFPVDNSQKGEYRTSATYSVTYAEPKANVT